MREHDDEELIQELAVLEQELCQEPAPAAVAAIRERVATRRSARAGRFGPRSWQILVAAASVVIVAMAGVPAAEVVLNGGRSTSGGGRTSTLDPRPEENYRGCVEWPDARFVSVSELTRGTGWVLPSNSAFGAPVAIYTLDALGSSSAPVAAMARYQVDGYLVTVERYRQGMEVTVSGVIEGEFTHDDGRRVKTAKGSSYTVIHTGQTPALSAVIGAMVCSGSRFTWSIDGFTYAIAGPVDDNVLRRAAEELDLL
ncbi:hypothetical protein ACTG9Q_18780 [Actinokineospora sp. 24-640]